MNKYFENIVSILPHYYKITTDFFKEKIDKGEELKKLEKEGLVEVYEGTVYLQDALLKKNNVKLTKEEENEIHKDLIENYYKDKLFDKKIIDFDEYDSYKHLYINLAYHYMCIEKYNSALEVILKIADRMIKWGDRERFFTIVDDIPNNKISLKNSLWILFYKLQSEILIVYNGNINEKEVEEILEKLKSSKAVDMILYIEYKNLEGCFLRIYNNDIEGAINSYYDGLKTCKENIYLDKCEYKKMLGRLYLNISLCFQNSDYEKVIRTMDKAETHIMESKDMYYIVKYYYLRLHILYKIDKKSVDNFKYYKELFEIMERYSFPDIERHIFSILAKSEIEIEKNFEAYFELITNTLACDLVLYFELFEKSLSEILMIIQDNYDESCKEIHRNLNKLIDFLRDVYLFDESNFLKCISNFMVGIDYDEIKREIKNESLKNVLDEYINLLKGKNV